MPPEGRPVDEWIRHWLWFPITTTHTNLRTARRS